MRKFAWIALGAVGCLLIYLGWLFFSTFELYTRIEERRLERPEVRKNPYLALEYFLNAGEREASTLSYKTMPAYLEYAPEDETLFIFGNRTRITGNELSQLLTWVESGGALVVEAYSADLPLDDLFSVLGITVTHFDVEEEWMFRIAGYKVPASIIHEGAETGLTLAMPISFGLECDDCALTMSAQQYADHPFSMVQMPYGKGSVTVLGSAQIWNNETINGADNIWLLDRLAGQKNYLLYLKPVSRFAISQAGQSSIFSQIWRHYRGSLLIFIGMLGALLWAMGTRIGPIEAPLSRDRRQLSTYLNALAEFRRKREGDGALIATLQEDILIKIERKYGRELRTREAILTELSVRANLPLGRVRQAMEPLKKGAKLTHLQLTHYVIDLQTIRKTL